jgi:hypothetical protein
MTVARHRSTINESFLIPQVEMSVYPIGQPPTYSVPGGLPALPIFVCEKECSWKQTGLILDGPNRDFAAFQLSTFPGGVRMARPHPTNRAYLVEPSGQGHEKVFLKNRILAFDVDISRLQCGYNAALYYSMMPFHDLGKGYCDAQGTRKEDACNEYDVLEANVAAVGQATHSCTFDDNANCDNWGCSINSRRSGGPKPFGAIDTTKPFRVTTKFITNDGTDKGTLVAVEQRFHQNKKEFQFPTITESYCLGLGAGNPEFPTTGKLEAMSQAFDHGMTMIFSLWGFGNDSMSWLDGGINNPDCAAAAQGDNSISFSNIVIAKIQ